MAGNGATGGEQLVSDSARLWLPRVLATACSTPVIACHCKPLPDQKVRVNLLKHHARGKCTLNEGPHR